MLAQVRWLSTVSGIRLRSNSGDVKESAENGLVAEDGSEVKADVVLIATDYGNPHNTTCTIADEHIGKAITPIRGFDEEGKEIVVPNLWLMMGTSHTLRPIFLAELRLVSQEVLHGAVLSPST